MLLTRQAIANSLGIEKNQVEKILKFLISIGLLEQTKSGYHAGTVNIHLGNKSPFLSRHHFNWRMQALQRIEHNDPKELYFTSPITVSEKDVTKVREVLIRAAEEIRPIVSSSPEEFLYCYNMDLFRVGKQKP